MHVNDNSRNVNNDPKYAKVDFSKMANKINTMKVISQPITPNIPIVGGFFKVSRNQWDLDNDFEITDYKGIKLPKRATEGSAGYDFFSPYDIMIGTNETVIINTGIKVQITVGWVLMVFPRSGLGFKYEVRLANTIGIIDSDYINADNEGHIKVKLRNPSNENVFIKKGQAFCQGVFIPYGITRNDYLDKKEVRSGGFGSTTK